MGLCVGTAIRVRVNQQIAKVKQDLALVEQELETAFARWETLESIDQS